MGRKETKERWGDGAIRRWGDTVMGIIETIKEKSKQNLNDEVL